VAWEMPDLRVITDTTDLYNASQDTLLHLVERGTVKSIPGAHAMMYIFDSRVLRTFGQSD